MSFKFTSKVGFAHIPEKDRIPLGQKIAFSFGGKAEWFASGMVTSTFWMPFFHLGLDMSPVVLGLILMIMRAWDAVSDPLVGNLSDNTRTRWGRRRPWMFFAAITTAVIFPFIWNFPESVLNGTSWLVRIANHIPFLSDDLSNQDKARFVYLTVIGLIYFTSFTSWSMPYYGLQLELTPNYDERTRLNMVAAFVGKITSFFTGWAFLVIVFVGTVAKGDPAALEDKPEWVQSIGSFLHPMLTGFAGNHQDDRPIVLGMKIMCWVLALLILFAAIIPAIFVKERYYNKEAKTQKKDPFFKSIKESVTCTPLWSLISASFFLVMGYTAISSLGTYVAIYYVCDGDMIQSGTIAGLKGSLLAVSGIALLPFFTWLGDKYDKRVAVMTMLCTCIFGHLFNFFLMNPEHPYLMIISGFFESSAISAVWLFVPSMKADVADWDEVHTHRRREGSINAFYSWFIKTSLVLSMGISGFVLKISGFDSKLEHQPQAVIDQMFHIYLFLPAIIWAIALLSVWFYPLTRQRCADIRKDLEDRRGYI
ncbi:MFS transporter [Coraliomargarita parva]|uniref:MFS transporter n=1 Tax=Coraliomargarita parva TaxID=3014050 RepID=UPI0022B40B83|nr:MFS transporter [Coraliomargarita parva]